MVGESVISDENLCKSVITIVASRITRLCLNVHDINSSSLSSIVGCSNDKSNFKIMMR